LSRHTGLLTRFMPDLNAPLSSAADWNFCGGLHKWSNTFRVIHDLRALLQQQIS